MLFLSRAELAPLRAELIRVWNAASGGQLPMAEALWRQNVEDAALYQDGDCLVYESDGAVSGFAVTRMLTPAELAANPDMAADGKRGHIMALAIDPAQQRQGIGGALLRAAEDRLVEQGATSIALWGPAGHLVPGPPADYGDTEFWVRHGYSLPATPVDLRRSLDDWTASPPPASVAAGQYSYRQGRPGEEDAIIGFLAQAFPGGWRYSVARFFARGYSPTDITLLVDATDTIQGFLCAYHGGSGYIGAPTHWYPAMQPGAWGGVGPLGVAREIRGRRSGLGLGLVAAGVDYLYRRGVRDCAIDWTTLVDFYGRLGFPIWKRYLMLEKKT